MRKNTIKLLSIILICVMLSSLLVTVVVTLLQVSAYAADGTGYSSPVTGANLQKSSLTITSAFTDTPTATSSAANVGIYQME